jgi:putative transcriptional regulator
MSKNTWENDEMDTMTFGELLIQSAQEAEAHAAGKKKLHTNIVEIEPIPRYTPSKIKALRERLSLPQTLFGGIFGVSKKTVEAWEAGTRKPGTSAARLLAEIESNPAYVDKVLHVK